MLGDCKMNLYNKYYDILKHLYNVVNIIDNNELKEDFKRCIINMVNQLSEKDKDNSELYLNILNEFGFNDNAKKISNNLENQENKQIVEETNSEIIENSAIIPNNNKSEIIENENIKELKNDYLENQKINENEQTVENNNSELIEDKKNSGNNSEVEYKDLYEYVFNKIYRNENKLLGDEFQYIMRDLVEAIKQSDEEKIKVAKNKYDKFVNDNSSILDKNKMEEYYLKTYKEYEVKDQKKQEGFKIKNVKRTYNSKLKNRTLSLLALAGVGVAFANPLYLSLVGVGGYLLYRKFVKNAKSLIERNGLQLDDKDNLVDSN